MPAARYWRVSHFETYAGSGLSLSEVALHDAGGRVDGLAVLNATIAPASGVLALLGDGLFDAAVSWSEDAVSKPGFALMFDFGAGVTKDVTKVGLAGPIQAAFAHRFTLEYSSDGSLWTPLYTPPAASKWRGASTFYELDAAMASNMFPGLIVAVGGATSTKSPLVEYRRDGDSLGAMFSVASGSLNLNGVAVTSSGDWAATVAGNDVSVRVYRRVGFDWIALGTTDVNLSGNGASCAFSPDGQYLAATCTYSPWVMIYKRSGNTFAKLPNPATLPPNAGNGCAFSPDGVYLAITHETSPFITIYKRSGDTFIKLSNPASLPTGAGAGCAFSPDGVHLAIAQNTSPYITIYRRDGDAFTKLANPASLPSTYALRCAFSPDGAYLAVVGIIAPLVVVYKRSGDTFTRLADPTPPLDGCFSVAFDPSANYLAVGHRSSPFLTTYKRSGDAFSKLSDPGFLPTDTVTSLAWMPFNDYGQGMLAANYSATPLRNTPPATTLILSGGDAGDTKTAYPLEPIVRDMQDFGLYRICGTTKLDAKPTDLPVRRRVQLYNQRDGRLIRETWSDPATGAWSFDNIRGGDGTRYFVCTFDYTEQKRAVIADNLLPEAM